MALRIARPAPPTGNPPARRRFLPGMRPGALVFEAAAAVATNRFRAVLAVLGITIGVGSVIAIVGLGDGAKVVVRDAISSFGAGSLMVMPDWRARDADGERYETEYITIEDVEQINSQADAVKAVTPEVMISGQTVRHGDRSAQPDTTLYGTLPLLPRGEHGQRGAGPVPQSGRRTAAAQGGRNRCRGGQSTVSEPVAAR